ncbi:MAG TPA: MBL fold metallo-hydrolase [Pirellulaceae bacterium]|nr:MBL fold metallo-hydrolase [Pirellulaceae bacterium]HMO92518.1 MBL fold metallo-hydrolase [Pirellulaceae bacterium]HMP68999.1 MBL fold metallo-hydrolase [Pirellulaceae bacterium]
MLDNAPFKSIEYKGLVIEGYSRAAVQTYWRIDQLRLGFDLGAQPWDFMGTPNWFISHTHLDHIAAIPAYVARRRMMKMEPPVIYLPESAVDTVHRLLRNFSRLDRGKLPCELVGVVPGDEIDYSRELSVTVGKTTHTVTSVCYLVYDRRYKLRPEFAQLTGDQIRDLRLAGQEVTYEVRVPLVAYMGDTTAVGLDENPDVYQAKVLISEMTFIAEDHRAELIRKSGHMHLDDYVQRKDLFKNDLILVGHISTRYSKKQAERYVNKRLPGLLDDRLKIWI